MVTPREIVFRLNGGGDFTPLGFVDPVAAVLVVLSWRRYRRAITELEQARREMQAEVQSIRDLLLSKQLHN